jgi:hypothetical protein
MFEFLTLKLASQPKLKRLMTWEEGCEWWTGRIATAVPLEKPDKFGGTLRVKGIPPAMSAIIEKGVRDVKTLQQEAAKEGSSIIK